MKKLWTLVFCLSLPMVFIACGKKEDKNNDQATVPANTCLVQNCDNSEYNNYMQSGFAAYNTSSWGGYSYFTALSLQSYYGNYSSQWGYFCGCAQGTTPVYNSVRGMGCVNNMYLQQFGQAAVFWTLPQNSQQFASYPASQAMQYVASYGGGGYQYYSAGSCVNFVAESCYVNQVNACREGASCRATVQGSSMGICIRN